KRLQDQPKVTIALTGANSNRGAEAGNTALSRARAESVKNYLVTSWGIDPKRISVSARNLPENPSSADDSDGVQENRRVEIAASSPGFLEPVTTTDTLRTVDPPTFRLKPAYTAEAGVRNWHASITQDGKVLKEFDGNGEPPQNVDWKVTESPSEIPLARAPLVSTFTVTDRRGKSTEARSEVQVDQVTIQQKREEKVGDVAFENFNLITFGFDKSTLSGGNQKIADEIKKRIKPTSEVEIIGYTDRLGEEQHNLELSQARALNTARVLGVAAASAKGAGETTTLYDNDLPEGRFYTRTVNITIKTPVNNE
ncbi:MAG: OmpA family protein, partial [Candidatus Kapaibacterium sp.]